MRTPDRKPFIPGSTLKGYTRSNFEILVPGCCFITNNKSMDKPPACKGDSINICSACDLFGVNKIMGRVSFSDAYLMGDFTEKVLQIPRLMGPSKNKYIAGTKNFINILN